MQPCRKADVLNTHANGTPALYRLAQMKEYFFLGLHRLERIYTSEVQGGRLSRAPRDFTTQQESRFVGASSTPFVLQTAMTVEVRTRAMVAH